MDFSTTLDRGTLVVILIDRNGNCVHGDLAITTGRPGRAPRRIKEKIFGGKSNKSWIEVITPNKGLHNLMRRWVVSVDDYLTLKDQPSIAEIW
jgi:hypothetical protein